MVCLAITVIKALNEYMYNIIKYYKDEIPQVRLWTQNTPGNWPKIGFADKKLEVFEGSA